MARKINRETLAQFGNLELLARQVVEGFITGMHKSPFHGFSVEFAEHRLYNTGESTRHIDWKLYARTGKFFTKKYEEETNLRCQIVIDVSSSMLFPADSINNKLEFSTLAAASLIELLKKQRDAVGITFFDQRVKLHTQSKTSSSHHRYLFSELESHLKKYSGIQKRSSTPNALHEIAELSHKRSLIIIFSDLLDDPINSEEFFSAIQHLKHNKHDVVVFHTLNTSMEIDFELDNRPYNLIDMETGDNIKLQPNEFQDEYRRSINKHFHEIKMKCTDFGIDFNTCDITKGFHQVLLSYLLKRQKLF